MSMGSTVATPEGGNTTSMTNESNTTSMGETPSTSEENDNSMATSADNSTAMMGNSQFHILKYIESRNSLELHQFFLFLVTITIFVGLETIHVEFLFMRIKR